MKTKIKYILLLFLFFVTTALYLWPDFHPENVIVHEHFWYIDLIMHGGYFFTAMLTLLLLHLKPAILYQALTFFSLSVVLELLQYFSYNRSVDWVDIVCNFVGIVSAMGVFAIIKKYRAATPKGK